MKKGDLAALGGSCEVFITPNHFGIGQVITKQFLSDLPNYGRNPFSLAAISPNYISAGNPTFNRQQDQSGSSQISLAGGPVRGNNYLLDGVPIADIGNRAVIIPTFEAIQELKMQVNNYDAEAGRTGGGVFNVTARSGSNQLHGPVRLPAPEPASSQQLLQQPQKNAGMNLSHGYRVAKE